MKITFSRPWRVRFARRDTPRSTPIHRISYPLPVLPRLAVLGYDFAPEPNLRCLTAWTVRGLESARPQALAASYTDLEEIASLRACGILKLKSLTYPLIAISTPAAGLLTDAQRDRLWRWFRLPVYEQVRLADGRLLARECESLAGLHPEPDAPPKLPAIPPCPCGSSFGQATREQSAEFVYLKSTT